MSVRVAIFASAVALACATPVLAQGVYIETPGGTVGVGPGAGDRRDYRDDDMRRRGDRYNRGPDRAEFGCRTITVQRDDGSYRRTRRCD